MCDLIKLFSSRPTVNLLFYGAGLQIYMGFTWLASKWCALVEQWERVEWFLAQQIGHEIDTTLVKRKVKLLMVVFFGLGGGKEISSFFLGFQKKNFFFS